MQLDDFLGTGQFSLYLGAVPALDLEDQIVAELRVYKWRTGRNRRARGGNGGHRLVIDGHCFSPVLGGKARHANHGRDDVADVAHLTTRKRWPWRAVHWPSVTERHRMHNSQFAVPCLVPVASRQRQHYAGHLRRCLGVDRSNGSVCVRASYEYAPDCSWKLNVIDVAAAAPQQPHVFAPPERLT